MTLFADMVAPSTNAPVLLGLTLANWRLLALLALVAALSLLVLYVWQKTAWQQRMDRLRQVMAQFTVGHFDERIKDAGPVPWRDLTDQVNQMAGQLQTRMSEMTRQQFELNAILASMIEGVIAVDPEFRPFIFNKAAFDIVGVTPCEYRNRHLLELIRNADLHALLESVLDTQASRDAEISLPGERERIVWAHGAVVRDRDQAVIGAVVVLEDITQLKRLESVRRDFVANVAHELKTPLTSIIGYIETLLDGIDNPEDAERFLGIVAKQSERLNAIIDDLLALANIEQQRDSTTVRLCREIIRPVLSEAIDLAQSAARNRQITLELHCADDVAAFINAPLLEQALTNLLDNAVKYAPSNSSVTLRAESVPAGVLITVEDQGPGIEPRHLPRIFERFYRVDKSRSRTLGGTGLGLAIVKHIAQVHQGDVSVESEPGRGSAFTIRLPRTIAGEGPERL